MDYFNYRHGQLYAEDVAVNDIIKEYGTPCYIYSRATLERHWRVFDQAFGKHPHRVCYAVKANSNLAILNVLARLGSGFDVVSQGELERVLAAGGAARKVIFSGVGKQDSEIKRALQVGINCFDVESLSELQQLGLIAREVGRQATIALRINPNVDAGTHPYITTGHHANKFGITQQEAIQALKMIKDLSFLRLQGLAFHLGSQLMSLEPFLEALRQILVFVDELKELGIEIRHLNIGGGLGVRYSEETPPTPAEYAAAVLKELKGRNLPLIIEPGRAIAANAGILVTRIIHTKQTPSQAFAIVDSGMNDLLRPALYGSWHEIIPVTQRQGGETHSFDVVGPLCESGDFLGKSRELSLQNGDVLAVRTAGAYGFTMSSNYNSRPRPAEVMVDGANYHLIRKRETIPDLFAHEQMLPES